MPKFPYWQQPPLRLGLLWGTLLRNIGPHCNETYLTKFRNFDSETVFGNFAGRLNKKFLLLGYLTFGWNIPRIKLFILSCCGKFIPLFSSDDNKEPVFFKSSTICSNSDGLYSTLNSSGMPTYEIFNTINESFLRGSRFSVGQESLYFFFYQTWWFIANCRELIDSTSLAVKCNCQYISDFPLNVFVFLMDWMLCFIPKQVQIFFWQRPTRCVVTNLYNVLYAVSTQQYIQSGPITATCFDLNGHLQDNKGHF